MKRLKAGYRYPPGTVAAEDGEGKEEKRDEESEEREEEERGVYDDEPGLPLAAIVRSHEGSASGFFVL